MDKASDPKRITDPADEAYLRLVGERVRLQRMRLSMSRKVLSQASNVSERYLAELERGTGNASLLILRRIASAMCLKVADFVSENPQRPVDLTLATTQLERLSPSEVMEARRMLAERFGPQKTKMNGLVALIGLRGAGKAAVGKLAAEHMQIPFIELDREIERESGMELSEIFSAHGEETYRKFELEILQRIVKSYDRAIITTGGGIVTAEENFQLLLANCFTVWMRASPEQLIERARKAVALRPTGLSRQATTELTLMLENRQPLYARADAGLDTTDHSDEELAQMLMQLIKQDESYAQQDPTNITKIAANR